MRALFLRHLAQTSPAPIGMEVERAEGRYLYTPSGERVLDLIAGISVSVLGHGHPAVVAAVQVQAARHMHVLVYGELVQAPQAQLAEALSATMGHRLESVYLVSSGTEAIEGAIKLARRATGRAQIVACRRAYHGSSHATLAAGGGEALKAGYLPLVPGITHMRFGVEADLELIGCRTAAVLIETVQGEAGVRIASPAYWQALQARCRAMHTLLILDEIQAGMGRTGTLWAHQAYPGLEPDILVTAKGLGGGMPIGAFMASRELMQVLTENPVLGHITTFGGHPVSCAAALATLHTLAAEELPAQVAGKEALFRRLLEPLGAVRSAGLLMALEVGSFARVQQVLARLLERHGVLSDWFLYCDTALRIAPPLNITEAEIEYACEAIGESLN